MPASFAFRTAALGHDATGKFAENAAYPGPSIRSGGVATGYPERWLRSAGSHENHDASKIYGNVSDAPYLNANVIPQAAIANQFRDQFPIAAPAALIAGNGNRGSATLIRARHRAVRGGASR